MKEEFKELYDFPKTRLSNHLIEEDNERLIFSGRYGIGKTTFLKHFFEQDIQEELIKKNEGYFKRFLPIHLFPVNYSVASNEDIFKYIKFDILHELLNSKLLEIEPLSFGKKDTIPEFIKENILDILAFAPYIGKSVFGTQKEVWKLYNKFLKYHADLNKTDGDVSLNFMKALISEEGTIYEDNYITRVISDFITQIKEDNNLDIILVIDDLDRVDPNHIFRLFNVFAAHFDNPGGEKIKFGFDKVILVCDIDNIKNIFHNRYGENVDFSGYIDKFYSKEVFVFDNNETIKSILYKIINNFNLIGNNFEHTQKLNVSSGVKSLLSTLLFDAILAKQINLRALFKFYKSSIDLTKNTQITIGHYSIYNWQSELVVLFDILIKILGDKNKLKELLIKCSNNGTTYSYDRYLNHYKEVLLILDYKNHQFKITNQRFTFLDGTLSIRYVLKNDIDRIYYCDEITPNDLGIQEQKNMFYLCLKTIKLLEEVGYY